MTEPVASAPFSAPWLFQVHRRPHRRMVAFAAFLGFLMAVGSVWLLQHLMVEPSPWLAWGAGLALGLLIVQQMAHGSAVRVDAAGRLTYGLRGKDNLVVDLRHVRAVRFIRSAMLQGAGLEVDPEQVELLDRKGVSRAMLDAWADRFGAAVVLEFLDEEDTAALAEVVSQWQKTAR